METDESTGSSGGDTLETIAIVSGVIASFFIILAASVSLSFFYCYCCHRRSDRERTEDMGECGDSSPSPVASIGPVAFQPQGEREEGEREEGERERELGEREGKERERGRRERREREEGERKKRVSNIAAITPSIIYKQEIATFNAYTLTLKHILSW